MKNQEDEFIRKRKARQKKARKRRRIRLAVFLAVLALAVFCVLSVTVLFPIKTITVRGSERYDAESVIAASGLKAGNNIIRASEKDCREQLRKLLPYVANVNLKKTLSGNLTLTVTEAEEARAYLYDEKFYLVSGDDHILCEAEQPPEGMLTVAANIKKPVPGEDIIFLSEKTGKAIEEVLTRAQEKGLKLDQIDLTQEVDISIKTDGRFLVKLGTVNYLEKKMDHLAAMIREMDPAKTGNIDLSMWTPDNTQGIFVEKSMN